MPKAQWRLATGEYVHDRSPSHIHDGVRPYLGEILASINSRRRHTITQTVEYDRPVGVTSCVATRPDDTIIFARRKGRRGVSRFVKNRRAEPTRHVSVVLRRTDRGDYQIMTAHFGRPAPREPWSDGSSSRMARDFWQRHAFAWGAEPIVRGTESYRPPGRR